MSAGTLTLTNNSAAVTGSGTAFTTELAAGDFIVVTVGGIPYTLAIKTVNSNTSLTLVSSYTGPTQAGAAWYAVPRVAMNLVTAALVAQSAEALRGLNYDKQNWQSIFSGTGNVTVTLPDGSSFTGPAWNSFTQALNGKADKVNGAVPVNQGGTGATNAADVRTNLGLGSSATKDVGTAAGNVLQVGAFGVGTVLQNKPTDASSSFISDADGNTLWAPANGCGFQSSYTGQRIAQLWITSGSAVFSRFLTTTDPQTPKSSVPWAQLQSAGTSDINFKKVTGDLDLEVSLANIVAMDFKTFYYLADEAKTTRRGVIAQELEKIDPQYVHSAEESGKMTLDLNPLMLDALAAIKALAVRVSALEEVSNVTAPGSSAG